jgi:tRNA pseudouridine13 synthase
VKSDLDLMNEAERPDSGQPANATGVEKEEKGGKIAVVLKFQLGASQYATMAIRELSKGGVVPYKPDFHRGR